MILPSSTYLLFTQRIKTLYFAQIIAKNKQKKPTTNTVQLYSTFYSIGKKNLMEICNNGNYTNLCAVQMISIRWIKDSSIFIYRIYFSMHYVEVTVVSQLKWSRHRESIHPCKLSIKEITWDIQVLITPPQLHHIAATTEINNII